MNRRALNLFSIGILILFTVVCGIYFAMSFSPEYVAKLNGRKVFVGEYMIYLREQHIAFEQTGGSDIWDTFFDGVSAEAVAKQNALDSIVYVKIMAEKAKEEGIRLNEEELAECRISAEGYYPFLGAYSEFIDFEDVIKVMEENALLAKLFEKITMEFDYSQRDFEMYYSENKYDYAHVLVNYISVQKEDLEGMPDYYQVAETILNHVLGDYPSQSLADVYLLFQDDFRVAHSAGVSNLRSYYQRQLDEISFYAIADLDPGQISDIIETETALYIFSVVYNDLENEQLFKEEVKEYYIAAKQREIFDDTYRNLLRDAQINKNSIIWDHISIIQ